MASDGGAGTSGTRAVGSEAGTNDGIANKQTSVPPSPLSDCQK